MSAPVLLFTGFAINKYHFKVSLITNTIGLCAFLVGYHQLFNYGFKKDKFREYTRIYEANKKRATDQRYRGLKLFHGKHYTKVDEPEFTTSNLDDLKILL